ncbi:MAG TPA: flagellar basal-body MS-ring/collar protein FliF [Opitutaceae bacterium]|nr:flagellar basal-body MS-ring/collar protein FliF [Opitutaceae bacterium]
MKNVAQSLLGLWKELGLNQRVSLVIAALVVTAGLVALVLWSQRPDMQLLYGRLSEKDAAAIISQLQSQNIPHKVTNGGSTVYVASDQVYRMRMELASKGLPTGDGVGFEIFDKGQFGLSDFVQRTNYLRALQGELARTISQLEGVRSARVMIVQPENRLLLTDQNLKPTASVFVELATPRMEMDAVNSIRHLVANAVQGLQPDQVAVVDQRGRVLSEELRQDPTLGTASSQMKYRAQVEDYFAKKVESMLIPVVGANNAIVRVSAEIDTEATTLVQEKFDPEGQVVRSQTTVEDTSNTTETRPGGGVGISANTPDKGGEGTADATKNAATPTRPSNVTDSTRKNRTTSYEIGRSVTNVTRQPGTVKSLTASVFLAERGVGADGKPLKRTPEELAALRQIVINALGLKAAPGQSVDSLVSLQEMAFQTEPISQEIQKIQKETRVQGWLETGSRYIGVVIAAMVLFVFWKMMKKQKVEPVPMELLAEAPDATKRALQTNGTLSPEMLNELIRAKPANIGTALRDWVAVKKN